MRIFLTRWLAKKAFNYIGHFMDVNSELTTHGDEWKTLCAARSILIKYMGE